MVAKNALMVNTPEAVRRHIKTMGENLRIARIRRQLTIAQVAEKIGTGPRAVMDAEKGKVTSNIATYIALFWAYGLDYKLNFLIDPFSDDKWGQIQAFIKEPKRARPRRPSKLRAILNKVPG